MDSYFHRQITIYNLSSHSFGFCIETQREFGSQNRRPVQQSHWNSRTKKRWINSKNCARKGIEIKSKCL